MEGTEIELVAKRLLALCTQRYDFERARPVGGQLSILRTGDSSHLHHLPIYVATNDGTFRTIVNGKTNKLTKAEMEAAESKQ